MQSRPALERHQGDAIMLFADTPLVEPATLRRLIDALGAGAQIAALGFEARDASGYGRLILDDKGRVSVVRIAMPRWMSARSGSALAAAWRFACPIWAGYLRASATTMRSASIT